MNSIPQGGWLIQIQQALDILTAQQQVTANNLANVNTPAFNRSELNFHQELEQLLGGAEDGLTFPAGGQASPALSPAAAAGPELHPTVDTVSPARADGNNVNLEKEMVDLAQTNEVYSALTRAAGKNIRMFRYVISGGR